jgi:outer membrane protein OmpA-like peptidoglycan-associated protein
MKIGLAFVTGAMVLGLAVAGGAEQKDDPKCKDHPLFTRMPTYWIHNCTEKEFDRYEFLTAKGKKTPVEGQLWKISYYPQGDAKAKPSDLQIIRNFENAVAKLGGTVVYSEKGRDTFRLAKDGKEIWVEVSAEFTGKYGLAIVQKEAMAQDVVADAAALSSDIRATGHVAVDGILFDTAKSDIKPESAKAIGEIAKMLKGDPALKVFVVGHTDTVGNVDGNMKLSRDRAGAVVQALVKEGIAAGRLRGEGCGPFAPVASNETEEGRAKNRRVELVKQP